MKPFDPKTFQKPSQGELKKKLSPLSYEVTQEEATERPFDNAFASHHAEGIYVDIVSGEPLFSSTDKYDSGCGWPSFVKPIEQEGVTTKADHRLRVERTEVRSKHADSHLGHVFEDGPKDRGGLRYCINSAALRFVPKEKLEEEGYGKLLALFPGTARGPSGKKEEKKAKTELATLAGGCFWGMEELLRKQPGVKDTKVGYTGGESKSPTYEQVKTGSTGHAETVQIEFDPEKTSYEKLLRFFFKMHDPTTLNQQGNDLGTQYRSVIFFHGEEQRRVAEEVKKVAQKAWGKPVVTELVPFKAFHPAEDYHQNYLQKHPNGYTCHWVRKVDL